MRWWKDFSGGMQSQLWQSDNSQSLKGVKDFTRQEEITCERVGKGGLLCSEDVKTV